jgi:hypothetical protein
MHERARTDFRWLTQSPALVNSEALQCPIIGQLEDVSPSDSDLARAVHATQSPRFRLGAYFEGLVEAYLRHSSGVSNLRTNIVVSDQKRTLGELDFLFDDEHGQTQHWEVAVKFYLYVPGHDQELDRCFLGPRTVDNLARKIGRMRDHQLRLPELPATKDFIVAERPIQSRALIRGRLFYPLAENWEECTPSALTTADHLRGWWTRACSVSDVPAANQYLIVDKHDWMTCPAAPQALTGHSQESLQGVLDGKLKHPLQVIGIDEQHAELHRGFVVPDDWPSSPLPGRSTP